MSDGGQRSALVTGAAGGLGFAIAQRLAADGCRVGLIDIDGDGAAGAGRATWRAPRAFAAT